MNKTYIVTEGDSDKTLLKCLLPKDVMAHAELVVAGGRSHASSLARSILVGKRAAVALVIDSDTLSPSRIKEQQLMLEESLRSAASGLDFKVVLASPELEVLLFESSQVASAVTGKKLNDAELEAAKAQPKKYLASSKNSKPLSGILEGIGGGVRRRLQEHTLLAEIASFVRQQAVAGCAASATR